MSAASGTPPPGGNQNPAANRLIQTAMDYYKKGALTAAIPLFKQALLLAPNSAATMHFLGMAYHQTKDDQRALPLLHKAVEVEPRQTIFAINLGLVLSELGKPVDALQVLELARQQGQPIPELFNNLGQVYQQLGNLQQAIGSFEKALELRPAFPAALNNLGGAYSQAGRHQEAVQAFEMALQLIPRSPLILSNLGRACVLINQPAKALEHFKAALALDPTNLEASLGCARLMESSSQFDQALLVCEKALQKYPTHASLLVQVGTLQRNLGQYEAAQQSWGKAVAASSSYFPGWWYSRVGLPVVYRSDDEIARTRAAWLRGIQQIDTALASGLFSPSTVALPATNFYLHYQCQDDREAQAMYGRVVTRIAESQAAGLELPTIGHYSGTRKIKVGFVSAFFNLHTITKLFQGWITHLDKEQFETHVFHLSNVSDKATEFLGQHATKLVAGSLGVRAATQAIAQAQLDILIYTDIGMDAATQMLAALRLAPIQCQAWGHPVTSGLATIDYFLSSELMEPEAASSHYNEKLIRLPGISIRYPEPDASVADAPPGLSAVKGAPLFVCLQSLFKLLPAQDRLMARIAAQIPESRFVFIQHPSQQLTILYRRRLEQAFRDAGVGPDGRLIFVPQLKYGEFLGLAREATVILDSVGWSGGNTTLEALAFCKPIVTLPGDFMRGRHTAAILRQIGVTATITSTNDEYVETAVRLARDESARNALEEELRSKKHLVYNDDRPIRALEEFIRKAVRDEANES